MSFTESNAPCTADPPKPPKIRYTLELLNKYITDYEATIDGTFPEKVKQNSIIHFICKCGTKDTKSFAMILSTGVNCKPCKWKIAVERRHKSNLEKYGVISVSQVKSIQDKAKKTNLARYGVENPLFSKEIQAKACKTRLEKYGAEYTLQSKVLSEQIEKTNLAKYGVKNIVNASFFQEKSKATLLSHYGVDHQMKSAIVKENARKTNIKKYGTDHWFQAKSIKDKIKETFLNKYGVSNIMDLPEIKEKCKKTCLERYGVEYILQSKEFKDKTKATLLERYGVEHPSQSLEIQSKSQKAGYKYRDYTTPSGVIRKVQGYEPFALDILFKTEHREEADIITDRMEVPRIAYSKEDKTNHYYFPDIFIKSEKKIIEVKSTWTYSLHLEMNKLKWKATQAEGYTMEFWVFSGKGERTVITVPSIVSPFLTIEEEP